MIDKELIYRARNVNLYDYFKLKGYTCIPSGSNYRIKEIPGLFIMDCFYYSFYLEKGGNGIDCLMDLFGLSFIQSLHSLMKIENYDLSLNYGFENNRDKKKKKPLLVKDIIIKQHQKNTIAYLHKTRKIDIELIREFLHLKLILQDSRDNVVFPWMKKNGKGVREMVGAEIIGTKDQIRFKQLCEGPYGYGFNYHPTNQIDKIRYFESSIDLMSYISLFGSDSTCLYVSMAGLKPSVIDYFSSVLPSSKNILCTDNDEPSVIFIEAASESFNNIDISHQIPVQHKDWNDQLVCSSRC